MFNNRGSIWTGIGIGFMLSIAAIVILVLLSNSWRSATGVHTFENPAFGALIIIGIAQTIWMLPAALVLLVARRGQTLKGLLVVAGSVFLLNMVFILPILVEGIQKGKIKWLIERT